MNSLLASAVAVAGLGILPSQSMAAIVVDGDFSDWATVPSVATSIDNGISGSPDFAQFKVSHDDTHMYFYYQLHRAENPQSGSGTFLSIDRDNDVNTGFNVFSLGLVGAEASWQNDFPFEQAAGVWNVGALTDASYGASPYGAVATEVELRIPRTAKTNSDGAWIFPDDQTIGVMFWTDAAGNTDYIAGDYTITVPEPASLAIAACGVALLGRRRAGAC